MNTREGFTDAVLAGGLSNSISHGFSGQEAGLGFSGLAKPLKMKIRRGNMQKVGYTQDIHSLLWKNSGGHSEG